VVGVSFLLVSFFMHVGVYMVKQVGCFGFFSYNMDKLWIVTIFKVILKVYFMKKW